MELDVFMLAFAAMCNICGFIYIIHTFVINSIKKRVIIAADTDKAVREQLINNDIAKKKLGLHDYVIIDKDKISRIPMSRKETLEKLYKCQLNQFLKRTNRIKYVYISSNDTVTFDGIKAVTDEYDINRENDKKLIYYRTRFLVHENCPDLLFILNAASVFNAKVTIMK